MNVFVFDIETIPDVEGGRKLHEFDNLSDTDVARAMFQLRRQETGSDFLRLHVQRIVAISVVLRSTQRGHEQLKVWSLGEESATESELISRFYAGLDKYKPTLISWNGSGFDLPVLHYRSLVHGIAAPTYWDTGENDPQFRYNHYLNRYHQRHTDLMDILAAYQARANAPLDEIATLLGFPGKMGMNGSNVWDAFQAGQIGDIRDYCETDVLNTYLIYLRYELIRGKFTKERYEHECDYLRNYLRDENKPHLTAFLNAWH